MRFAAIFSLVLAHAAFGQALLVDRIMSPQQGTADRLGVPQGFLGDHFQLGDRGEVWVIDKLAVWAVADPSDNTPQHLGDFYENVRLAGAIEAAIPAPGQPAQPDCACHNLVSLKSGALQTGSDMVNTAGIRISAAAPGVWRVEFEDLRWSVPGGVPVQFGVSGKGRMAGAAGQRHTWFNSAAAGGGVHDIRLFDEEGKLLGRYVPDGPPLSPLLGMNVQVWAHKTVLIAISSSGSLLEVKLQSGQGFQPAAADPESFRLGPSKASPVTVSRATDAQSESLVLQFRREDTGLRPGDLTACLTGIQKGGIPFEGCDLVPKQ